MDANQIQSDKAKLAIEGKAKEYKYINRLEEEHNLFRQIYYLWVSRFFVVLATLSMMFMVLTSLSLFRLAPMVSVEPFLLINQNETDNIVRAEAIDQDMSSKDKILEMFIKQYVIYRNTIINDPIEMRTRWMSGGIVNYLSSPRVYVEFANYVKVLWVEIFRQVLVREVEIISVSRQGGSRSSVWKVDFKTYDLQNEKEGTQAKQEASLRVRYWTASVTAQFVPERGVIFARLINPLGFTVTRYSQTEVELF